MGYSLITGGDGQWTVTGSVLWLYGSDVIHPGDTFMPGRVYWLGFDLTAAEGWIFGSNTLGYGTFTVAGVPGATVVANEHPITGTERWITIIFPATEQTITNLDIVLPAPVTGEAPLTEVTNPQWTAAVEWRNAANNLAGTTFAPNTVYTANITVTAQTGFTTLVGLAANSFTVNIGAPTTGNSAGSGVLSHTFTATDRANPDVTWPSNLTATFGQTLGDVSLGANTGTVGIFTWTAGNGASVGAAGPQQHNVTFTPTDTTTYNTVNNDVTIAVGRATPTLADLVRTLPPTSTFNGSPRIATAEAASGVTGLGAITVEYALQGTTNWTTGEPTNAGIYQVRANIAEGTNFTAATIPLGYITINQATGLTATPPEMTVRAGEYSMAVFHLGTILLNHPTLIPLNTGPMTFSPAISDNGGFVTHIAFLDGQRVYVNVTDTADDGDTAAITITINTANFESITTTLTITARDLIVPDVTANVTGSLTFGQPLSNLSIAVATSGTPGTIVWNNPAAIPNVGESAAWIFTPTDTNTYATVQGTSAITVNPASQTPPTIEGAASRTAIVGDAAINLTASGGTGPGTFAWASSNTAVATVNASGVVTIVGAGTTNITVLRQADANHNASSQSAAVVLTVAAEQFTISLTPSGNHTFTAAQFGYTAPAAHSVTMANTGNRPTGALTVSLSGANSSDFTLANHTGHNLAVGADATFTVVPNIGLTPGAYTATVHVTGGNGISESFNISFTVNPAQIVGTVVIDVTGTGVGGSVVEGDVMTANVSGITPAGAQAGLTFQWFRGGAAIVGATSNTYTVVAADMAQPITVQVTGTGNFAGTQTSAAVEVGRIPLGGTVSILGTTALGDVLTLNRTALVPTNANVTITWLRDGMAIAGAVGESYTITQADLGRAITVQIVGIGDYTGSVVSPGVSIPAVVPTMPRNFTATPGNTQVTLAWIAPEFDGGATITGFQVSRDNGATWAASTSNTGHVFTGLTNGTAYTFRVRAVSSVGNSAYATANATPTAVITVTGVSINQNNFSLQARQTNQLTATVTPANAANTNVTWASDNIAAATVSATGIVTAVASGTATITVTTADGGHTDTVQVTVTRAQGNNNQGGDHNGGGNQGDNNQGNQGNQSPSFSFNGANSTFIQGSGQPIVLTVQASFGIFRDVRVGNRTLSRDRDFTAESGSTVITLHADYLDTLELGRHNLEVRFTNNLNVRTNITIAAAPEVTPDPPNVNYNPLTGGEPWINPFVDVSEVDWFFDAVRFAHQNNLFSGTSADTFSPNIPMTRAMMVTVLYRMAGEPSVEGLTNTFTDVENGRWHSDAIMWAAANGIVSGIGNNQFAPNNNITREQMAVILNNFARHMELDLPTIRAGVFVDEAEISAWAQDAVNALFEAGVISGMGNNHFNPQGQGTRAEVATMIRNFMEAVQFGPFATATNDYAMLRDEDLYYDRKDEDELEELLDGEDEDDNGADNDNTN